MTRFDAAVDDCQWLLTHVIDCDAVLAKCGVDGLDRESIAQMLGAAGDFIGSAIAPISEQSDRIGATLQGGRVITAPAWKEA